MAKSTKTFNLLEIRGQSGLKTTGGRVNEEFARTLQGARAAKTYREMADNDPIIGSVLFSFENMIRRTPVVVQRAEVDDVKADEAVTYLEECLDDMSHSFEDTRSEISSMLAQGWSALEIVYKRRGGPEDPSKRYRDGRIAWRKLAPRSQTTLSRWDFDEDGGVRGLWQSLGGNEVHIPIEKLLLFKTRSRLGNPEGRSLLRNAVRPWYFKKNIEEIEAIGVERDLAGLPVMQVPPEIMHPNAPAALKSLRADLEEMVQSIKRDERDGMLIPAEEYNGKKTGYKFSLLSTGGTRSLDTDAIIRRYDSRIAMSLQAELMLLGIDGMGSHALAAVKAELLEKSIDTVLEAIAAPFNRFAIPRLFALNPDFPQEVWPTIAFGKVSQTSILELADFLQKTIAAGAILPDKGLEAYLRERADLPQRDFDDEDELLMPPAAPAPAPGEDDNDDDVSKSLGPPSGNPVGFRS